MNTWIISKYAGLPCYGTLAPRLYYLAREFSRQGHQVKLIMSDANHLAQFPATKRRYNWERRDGVDVCWIKTRKYRKTASAGRVLSWFDFERHLYMMPRKELPPPDIVLVSSISILSIVYGAYLKRRYGARLVFEVRDIWPLTMVAEGEFSPWHPLVVFLGLVEKYGYEKADLVVGTMPRLDVHVREIVGRDVPFHCCPLGYVSDELDREIPVPQDVLERHLPEGKFIVGYAGSIGLTNALEPLIRCIENLADRADIHFLMLGAGDMRDRYMERLAGNSNVSFMPRVSKSEVRSVLRRCDILYLSTLDSPLWRFGQSLNKLVDYMLAGKPIVASYSGYRSMLNEAGSGFFVPAGDVPAIEEALSMMAELPASERREMGERGKKWILENRSYEVLAARYLAAIEEKVPKERTA